MNFRLLGGGGGLPNPFGNWIRQREAQQRALRKRASTSSSSSSGGASTSGRGSYFERVKARICHASSTLKEDLCLCLKKRSEVTETLPVVTWQGWEGPWKAALTSGSLSATGDLLAQFGLAQMNQVRLPSVLF